MPRHVDPPPGIWLVLALLGTGIASAAWLRAHRVDPDDVARVRTPVPDMRIDVNAASPAMLDVLPGIGPRNAGRIAADRAARGSFASLDDLARVPGIGPRTVEALRPYAVASSAPIR